MREETAMEPVLPETRDSHPPKDTRRGWRGTFFLGMATGCLGTVILLVVLVVGAAWLFQDWAIARQRARLTPPESVTASMADLSLQLVDPDGQPITLEAYRGAPMVVHLWSPTCPDCLAELPFWEDVWQACRAWDPPVRLIAVAVHGFDQVSQALREQGCTFPVWRAAAPLPPDYAGGVPRTVVIDAEGRVVLRHAGSARWNDPAVLRFLEGLSVAARAGS
ncbi:MAG TPA: TlpA disulfide reductase family protein [Candidatus Hydrogenedentes bacterium]|nr:TlpA disulfide reductase family protein [Candidatus Hydrogenedentota bacterium]